MNVTTYSLTGGSRGYVVEVYPTEQTRGQIDVKATVRALECASHHLQAGEAKTARSYAAEAFARICQHFDAPPIHGCAEGRTNV